MKMKGRIIDVRVGIELLALVERERERGVIGSHTLET